MESKEKVDAMLNKLGEGWIAENGYWAITKFEKQSAGSGVFTPNIGIPFKVFTNSTTGEVKMFLISLFEA